MNYYEFNVEDKTYKLRLTTRNIVALEKAIGKNPLGIFTGENEIPTITEMVSILFYSLQSLQHGIGMNEAYDIFDKYMESNSLTDFIPVILSIYEVSGIIRNVKGNENEKN
jgi:hypothetical protein